MSVLVTGASGMLGRVLLRIFEFYTPLGISKSGRDKTTVCDLSNEQAVISLFKAHNFQAVVHAAAYSDVDGCERDPQLAHESNALSTKYLARQCVLKKIPLIYVSTDYVFSGEKKSLYLETDSTSPINVYGLTKLGGEHYARMTPVSAIVRTSWLFGAGNSNSFVNAILVRLRKDPVVRVLADQVDSPTFVKDLSIALKNITESLLTFMNKTPGGSYHEIFQVCNAGFATRYEMTVKMKQILGLESVKVEKLDRLPVDHRPALRPSFAAMSPHRYETAFKTKMRPWEESLRDYLGEIK